jgi:phage terminase large subunit-like protein
LNNGTCKVYSADASTLDGLNISLGVIDEFHEAKDRKLYDVIKSSMGMRTQPLMIVITTAGFNLDSPCHDMYKLGVEILGGVKNDDSFWPFIYQLDENDDIEDDSNWIKCQPNLGVTVSKDFMRQELIKMKNDSTAEVGVKTKTFNMWCTSSMVWIKPETIVKCMKDVKVEEFAGSTGVIGVDLGSVNDLTAVSLLVPQASEYVLFSWNFIPEETYKVHENKPLYDKFIKEGTLFITPGNVCDYDYITAFIKNISQSIMISDVYYDKYNSAQWAIQMTEEGFNLTPFSQSIGNYNVPTKEFKRLVDTDKMTIAKSQNFAWQIGCCTIKEDHNGNQKPIKTSWRTQKIDSIISSTTALGGFLHAGGGLNDFEIFTIGNE